MRRPVILFASLVAALVSAAPAAAAFEPIRRQFGELEIPLVREGAATAPKGHAKGRISVIVQLGQPPLARWAGRSLSTAGGRRKLSAAGASSRAHLRRLADAQRAAEARLKRAIPSAAVTRRYRIVLNGLAVELPARALPTLVRLGFAERVSPNLRYRQLLNESPSIIEAIEYARRLGAGGEGMKIAIVDDGLDPQNPFFDPTGFAYPRGFPRGGTKWTSPKVIVARSFPGPGSGRAGRLAVDPEASFHGTHVAGIAAGVAGKTALAGDDHPETAGLTGVAPRAWIGNYRVFTVPTPVGNVANTAEIVAAFESAVVDGMDVINFSGGGAESEPANDALVEVVGNVAAAGVVPVIAAGNDRDEFGFGTIGSPSTAPEAISVAAASNAQVFSPALEVRAADAPPALRQLSFRPDQGDGPPEAWSVADQTLVDVGTLTGTDGKPVDRLLCGRAGAVNSGPGTLPAGSLAGAIALASRGACTFASKAERAQKAGAIGLVLVDNRSGEANGIPVELAVPGGMVADLDGARLRDYLGGRGGRAAVRVQGDASRIATGRSGVITSFSAGGPTAFDHALKPDVTAPGGQILSSTPNGFGGPYAVFDGTSMATPHVAGAAALLLQRHPWWTPRQVKSALVSTAGPAWADTARTTEAPVTLGGGGLVALLRADDPRIFTEPSSLSFGDLNVRVGDRREPLLATVDDAGGGAGTWRVELRPQAASAGARLELPATVEVPPGGDAQLVAVARAAADAAAGENYGFVVLRRGDVSRRIPYFFLVTRPALADVAVKPLGRFESGDTLEGASLVARYGYPSWPFGPPPSYGSGPPMRQDGAERLYVTRIDKPVANFGVAVVAASENAFVDPWVLSARDETAVTGLAGTPVNVNNLTFGYRADIGAAGASLPTPGEYYVAVDSGRDEFTGRPLAGRYVLQSWVDDVSPPLVLPVTTRVSAGRPTVVARVIDGLFRPESGVDPLSLTLGYRNVLVGATAYDPASGLAVFALPRTAPALKPGTLSIVVLASDYQEAKNVASVSDDVMPNTTFAGGSLRVVKGPTVGWLVPERRECAARRTRLVVVASSDAALRSVRFLDGRKRIALDRTGAAGLYAATWRTGAATRGAHTLRAVVTDARGRTATAERIVRVCR